MLAYYAGFVPDDGQVAVYIPDLPGCITWGENIQYAFENAIEAVSLHVGGMIEDGEKVPKPSNADEAWAKIRAEHAGDGFGDLPQETQLLLVPAPEAAALGMTRSGFLALAAGAFQVEAAH